MSFVTRVNKVINRYPYISQGLISGVLQVTGDVIAQKWIEKKAKLDYKRSFNFLLIGCMTGLVLRKWYGVLDANFLNPKPFANAIGKIAGNIKFCSLFHVKYENCSSTADQLIFVPAFLGISTGLVGFIQTGSAYEIVEIINREMPDIMTSNYQFWPAVQLANFYFMPLNCQVGMNSILAVGWSTYFSWKTYSSCDKKSEVNSEEVDKR